jgi:hypothetical protein
LRQEEEAQRPKEFEADRAKCRKICASVYATEEVKAKA